MKANLAMSLGHCLGTTFAFYTKAIGFHWNVKGPDFSEFHDLFGDIYADAQGAIDPIAESILKLGFDSPATLSAMSHSQRSKAWTTTALTIQC